MSLAFESSAAGPLNDDTVLECGVCWWTYDPTHGDEAADIPPGTPFSALPEGWRCPSCDAERVKFMVTQPGVAARRPVHDQSLEARAAALVAAYEAAEASMIGLPVHNDALRIEAVGFRPHDTGYAGVIVTPWCMNIVLLPADPDAPPPGALGSSRSIAFPSGAYSFIAGRMDGVGAVETCSLFSPMDEFDDPEVAKAAAEAAVEGLFAAPEPEARADQRQVSRRFLLTLNGAPP